jgi:hypothetical protein
MIGETPHTALCPAAHAVLGGNMAGGALGALSVLFNKR